MAQAVITLASEETCQDILTRVKNIESKTNSVSTAVGGGYRHHVNVKSLTNNAGTSGSITVHGKAKVFLTSSVYIYNEKHSFSVTINIDGKSVSCAINDTLSLSGLTCENYMTITVSNTAVTYITVIAYFEDSSGYIS